MTRGTYGPLDRDRHFVLGWGTDKLAAYTTTAALRPIMPAVDTALRASQAANRWWVGSQGVGGRTEADRPATEIGHEFFHTIADRARAIATLSTHFKALANDLGTWQLANMASPAASKIASWLAIDVTPTLEEWSAFVARERSSWWTRAATSWDAIQEWWQRLRQLRGLARAHGIELESVEPMPLPKTIWERSSEGKGSEVTALLGILKIGAFTALTITGAVSMYGLVQRLRQKAAEKTG